ncbi:MAG: exopolyphosphatase [Desulfatitalea sp.]|nr:exopolyphosphatase [Desulfatitalea sp.]
MQTRIITRPDFDGVVCAVLLKEALGGQLPVVWAQPADMQAGLVPLTPHDVVANLPLGGDVDLWFDHHVSNVPRFDYKGIYRMAPSAAGLVQAYYEEALGGRFETLVHHTDRIDAAQLTLDEILYPERYPFVLLSMTITYRDPSAGAYCDHLVDLLRKSAIEKVMTDPEVRQRCDATITQNKLFEKSLLDHTELRDHVSITDLRGLSPVPDGNRFLVYSLFPQAVVNIKIFDDGPHTVVKLGHSILNRGCRVNVGQLLSRYGGGGHRGAGACPLSPHQAEQTIADIVAVLLHNEP